MSDAPGRAPRAALASALAALALLGWAGPAQADDGARKAAHLLGYIAADYGGAVRDGKVVNPSELSEQLSLLQEAKGLVEKLPSPGKALGAIARAQAIIDARGEAAELASVLGSASGLLLASGGLVPPGQPSLERGKVVFEKTCASCHGSDGAAQTV